MARSFGELRATFYDLSNNAIVLDGSQYLTDIVPDSAEWVSSISQLGNGRVRLFNTARAQTMATIGRICVVEQRTGYVDANNSKIITMFLIEDVEPFTDSQGISMIEIRGGGVEKLLTRYPVFAAIGAETIYNTTLTSAADEPTSTTLSEGAPTGNNSARLASLSNVDVGDEVRIQMDNTNWHIARVLTIEPPGAPERVIQFEPDLPDGASSGNAVSTRTARLVVGNVANMVAGQKVIVTLNSGTHTTTIKSVDSAAKVLVIVDGIASDADSGKNVAVYDYSKPTTNDVTQVMAKADGWSTNFQTGTGTAIGTAHKPVGESVFDILLSIAERTGEFFRYTTNWTGVPTRAIDWRRTPDESGVVLKMYQPNAPYEQDEDETDETVGTLFSLKKRTTTGLITRIYPSAGNQNIGLRHCSNDALSVALNAGCYVTLSEDASVPDSVTHSPGVSNYGVRAVSESYGDISVADDANLDELTAASDQLLLNAIQSLVLAQSRVYFTAEAFIPVHVKPGQKIQVRNTTNTAPFDFGSTKYIILDVTERTRDGRPYTVLTLSDTMGLKRTSANSFGMTIRAMTQTVKRIETRGGGGKSIVVSGGGGEPAGGPYVPVVGGVTVTGNIGAAAGVTFDGVDVSAHVADANAHHAAVTLANTGLSLSGQSVGLNLAASSGLSISSGVSVQLDSPSGLTKAAGGIAIADTLAGQGLAIGGKVLSIALASPSGLTLNSGLLALGTPGTLSATSTNLLQAGSHTHAVTATDNAKTTVGTLLKGSAAGDLGLRWLTADKAITPIVETAAGNLTLDPAGGVVVSAGNLSVVGARSIVTDSGSLTLAPVNSLIINPADNIAQINSAVTLKTAHWASGFLGTGWGLTYDGVFDARQITADELHVAAFIADTARVKVGSEYITPSMALLSRNFTIPAVSASGTIYVEDAPGLEDMPLFADNDWLMLRIIDRTGGGLKVANVWGQVAGYANLSGGEQSWTFTTRQSASTGQIFRRGAMALCFGKSGDGWLWMTTLDAVGSPYLGITTWQGANPYTDGNRTHRLRLGQLKGVSGVNEWGLQAGTAPGSYIRFTDIRNEIHGTRLSLYAGDGAQLRVTLASVAFYRTAGQFNTLTPDSDSSSLNATTTEGTFWQAINGGGASKYVTNAANLSGYVSVGLSNPTTFSSIHHVDLSVTFTATGFANDTARVYGQVFESDEVTPLTGELLLLQRSSNVSNQVVTVTLPHDAAATKAKWDGAKLRLRWEYDIAANQEAIRLDPSVPSLAVGNPLPTGVQGGGAGFWTGRDSWSGKYNLRIGGTSGNGPQMLYNGDSGNLMIRNKAGENVIMFEGTGASRFEGPMTIGTGGGIWQGTGTFAAPTTGLKIWNDGGVGRLATYKTGLEQITINTDGQLTAGANNVYLDREGITLTSGSVQTDYSSVKFRSSTNVVFGAVYGTVNINNGQTIMGLSTHQTNNATISAHIAAHAGPIKEAVTLNTSESIVELTPGALWSSVAICTGGGMTVGDYSMPPPSTLRFKERADNNVYPSSTQVDIFARTVGGVQKLYAKFGNGVVRELATAS